jgi:hypothetical protein
MELGIVGLPQSGKTTVFNAVSKGKAEVATYSQTITPNISVVKVPDPRLEKLTAMFNPKRTVPAEVTYIDVGASLKEPEKEKGIGGEFLNYISRVDALIHVVRAFKSEEVPHSKGSVNPERDIATMNAELAFSDLVIVERRLERLRSSLKGAKPQEKEGILKEQTLLEKIKSDLENGRAIREQNLTESEIKAIEGFKFLTAKPVLILFNIGEEQFGRAEEIEARFGKLQTRTSRVSSICGKLEMELSELSDSEAKEFRSELNLDESSGLDRAIKLSYDLLGLISFFTVGSDEVRAWSIPENTLVQKAAGKIHSDMERGFIRAEVVKYDDLVKCNSIAEARKRGLLRVEGKNYIVRDGDVITILFNV